MTERWLCLAILLTTLPCSSAELARLSQIGCPQRIGERHSQSAVTTAGNSKASAYLESRSHRLDLKNCQAQMTLSYRSSGDETYRRLVLSSELAGEILIVDWSPGGNHVLLADNLSAVTSLPIDHPARVHGLLQFVVVDVRSGHRRRFGTSRVFDVPGFPSCSTRFEALGFSRDGKIVFSSEPGPRWNKSVPCSTDTRYWILDRKTGEIAETSAAHAKVDNYGEVSGPFNRPCKSDPDVIGACFTVHGRASIYNGNPMLRIWRVGSQRLLGVQDNEVPVIPPNLEERLDLSGTQVYGDFEVCPFSEQRPGWMQMVCVESATNLFVEKP